MKRVLKNYETKGIDTTNNLLAAIFFSTVMGIIIVFLITRLVDLENYILFILGIIISTMIVFATITRIGKNEITGLYAKISGEPLHNCQGPGILFLNPITRRIGRIYDNTDSTAEMKVEKTPTDDRDPRQFVWMDSAIDSYVSDPLAYENNGGNDDVEIIIRSKQIDCQQKWIRSYKLPEIEGPSNPTISETSSSKIDRDIYNELSKFMGLYGVTLTNEIRFMNIKSSSDETREELGKIHFEEQQKKRRSIEITTRTNWSYLSMLVRKIDGEMDTVHFAHEAKKELKEKGIEINDYNLSERAIALAEIHVPQELRESMYDKAKADQFNLEQVIPKVQHEIIGGGNSGVLPIMNLGNNKKN